MSYTAVTRQRSHRYPLMGLGCGCASPLGALPTSPMETAAVVLATIGLIAAGLGLSMRRNRYKRSRR